MRNVIIVSFCFQHALNEKQLQVLHNKIDTEVANLRTTYEKYRNDVMKYSAGITSYSLLYSGLILGFFRRDRFQNSHRGPFSK